VARTLRRQGRFLKRVCRYDKNKNVLSADWYAMTPAEIELKAARNLGHRRCWVKDPNFELDVIVDYRDTKGPGGVCFLTHVLTFYKQYAAGSKTDDERHRILNSVMDSVHASGGRFLFKNADWYSLMDADWAKNAIHRVFLDATPNYR
jgi:hypothetical protein